MDTEKFASYKIVTCNQRLLSTGLQHLLAPKTVGLRQQQKCVTNIHEVNQMDIRVLKEIGGKYPIQEGSMDTCYINWKKSQ